MEYPIRRFCNACGAKIIEGACKCPPPTVNPVRHLDNALSILKGTEGAKRAPRRAQVLIQAMMVSETSYVVTANGRIVEAGEGTLEHAKALAMERAALATALGKTFVVEVL